MFKFLLSGISLVFTLTADSDLKSQLMGETTQKLKKNMPERSWRFFSMAARSAFFRVKLSQENTYELFMDFLNQVNAEIPDGADFIDWIGMLLHQHQVVNTIRSIPVFDQFVNWLKDECLCDYLCGIVVKKGACHLRLQTEGIKELYEKVLEGFN